ncbi:MAG: DNA polymerase III subunit delta, partial [Anaerolineae bacterium]|nr:DNA polymerase III subunit delta [Anaerolineae bacterium]
GTQVSLAVIQQVCDAFPFLAPRRLVIVEGLLGTLQPRRRGARRGAGTTRAEVEAGQRGKGRDLLEDLMAYLKVLPETTVLVLWEREPLPAGHPVLALAQELAREKPPKAVVREFRTPREDQLAGWIARRVRKHGGQITPDAAEALAAFVGRDLRRLDQEIGKLVTHAGAGQAITLEAVEALVPDTREASIFAFTDAVARRDARQALSILHRLLEEGQPPLVLLNMVARQVRVILQVKELQGEGLSAPRMARELGVHPYVVEKALRQGVALSYQALERAYRLLLEADLAIKTGAQEPETALDLLVVEMCRR